MLTQVPRLHLYVEPLRLPFTQGLTSDSNTREMKQREDRLKEECTVY